MRRIKIILLLLLYFTGQAVTANMPGKSQANDLYDRFVLSGLYNEQTRFDRNFETEGFMARPDTDECFPFGSAQTTITLSVSGSNDVDRNDGCESEDKLPIVKG